MGRRTVQIRLAWAYARHRYRRRFSPEPPASADEVIATYAADGLRPLTAEERAGLPAMSRCISCGLCALVVRRVGGTRPPDLANAYLRDPTLLAAAAADLAGAEPGPQALAAAAAACPVGVPLEEVVAAVRRLSAPA